MANGQQVGYARVSTTGQDLSLQRDRLSGCDKIFEEKASGARGPYRPALEEAMNYVREGDVLVFTKLDRLARSVLELITERSREGRERAITAGVKFGRKPKLTKRKERELLEMLESVVISKEDLARQFNVSRATVYRLAAKLDNDFEEQNRQG